MKIHLANPFTFSFANNMAHTKGEKPEKDIDAAHRDTFSHMYLRASVKQWDVASQCHL